mgnify:CR=1 FL=1
MNIILIEDLLNVVNLRILNLFRHINKKGEISSKFIQSYLNTRTSFARNVFENC